jgi:transaldolase
MHAMDKMASEKLHEGIEGFSKATVALGRLLANRLAELEGKQKVYRAAEDVFAVYDLDGDGLITREEWAGSAAAFNAFDADGDGCITPAELAAGIGAAWDLKDSPAVS